MKIGLDVDGVLADFVSGFCALVKRKTGREIPLTPQTWNWHRDAGVTAKEDAKVWAAIAASSTFWEELDDDPAMTPYVWQALCQVELDHALYFLTYRVGSTAKDQTEEWLDRHGFLNPTVLIVDDKGPVVKALQLDVFMDDRPSYCEAVSRESPATCCYLRQRMYNRIEEPALVARGVIPVPDVQTMLNREGLWPAHAESDVWAAGGYLEHGRY